MSFYVIINKYIVPIFYIISFQSCRKPIFYYDNHLNHFENSTPVIFKMKLQIILKNFKPIIAIRVVLCKPIMINIFL